MLHTNLWYDSIARLQCDPIKIKSALCVSFFVYSILPILVFVHNLFCWWSGNGCCRIVVFDWILCYFRQKWNWTFNKCINNFILFTWIAATSVTVNAIKTIILCSLVLLLLLLLLVMWFRRLTFGRCIFPASNAHAYLNAMLWWSSLNSILLLSRMEFVY